MMKPLHGAPGTAKKLAEVPSDEKGHAYPKLPDGRAVCYIAVTTVITMYSALTGPYLILLLYAIWMPHIKYKGRFILQPSRETMLPALFAGLCIASTLWSEYRDVAVRAGVELCSMLICTLVISRIVTVEAFVKGLILGSFLVLLGPFWGGSYSIDGFFSSKNQVGLIAEIGIYANLLYLFTAPKRLRALAFTCAPFAVCCASLVFSRSASSVATLAIVLAMSVAANILCTLPRRMRVFAAWMTVFLMSAVVMAAFSLNWQETIFQGLGKDATLTGRTYLWSEGFKVGMEMPVLGHGYNSFWVPGQRQAELYWYKFDIPGKSGFHFHNIYIQSFVDLGMTGFLLLHFMNLRNCYKSFRRVIAVAPGLAGMFAFGFSVMLLTRGFVEVDFLQPFAVGTLIFFFIVFRFGISHAPEKSSIAPVQNPRLQNPRSFRFPTQSALK